MKVTKTDISGLLIIQPNVFNDDRGYFFESYSKERYVEFGIPAEFVQDNISKSTKGTIRGLHYQVGKIAQGKLCQVIEGEVLDVAVDIRFNSPTFGKHFSLILNSEEKCQLWMPADLHTDFLFCLMKRSFHTNAQTIIAKLMKEPFFLMILI